MKKSAGVLVASILAVFFSLRPFSVFGQESSSAFVPVDTKFMSIEQSLLFDSKTWMGWHVQKEGPYGGGRFTIEDGAICSDPAHPGLLLTTGQFADFLLDFEVQTEEETDAFLLLRTSPSPKNLGTSCYAVVLAASSAHPERNICSFFKRRMTTYSPAEFNKKNADGSYPWKRYSVYADVKDLRVTCDSTFNNDCSLDDESVRRGYIGFLVTKGQARFRNIAWAPTRTTPLFRPESRQGIHWKPLEKNADFSLHLDSMEMILQGGPGTLETQKSFDNFILRAEFHAAGTQSIGDIFFRSLPGETFAGYRCALCDRSSERNLVSTLGERIGSLVPLQEARNVGAQNDQWHFLVVKAVDNHFQTWVNGIQTVDFADRRPENISENPQHGLRLKEGTIQIHTQSPDTTLRFKSIDIVPVSKRWISKEEAWYLKEQHALEFLPPRAKPETSL